MALIDPKLYEYATPRQAEYMQAIEAHGSGRKAAEALGVHHANVNRALEAAKAKAARAGYAPGHFKDGVAPGYAMGKVTVQRGADGNVERTWERQSPEATNIKELIAEAFEAAKEDVKPLAAIPAPENVDEHLCNLFIITDAHVGALAWHEEGGANWDLDIAEETLGRAFGHMIANTPKAKRAVVCFLGDLIHQDSNESVTPANRHLLDSDGRPRKIIRSVIKLMRAMIAASLATHEEVHVISGEGNHDEYTSGAVLPEFLIPFYENEPRININTAVLPYYVYEHGNVMLAFHHGHKKKISGITPYFAAEHSEMWGRTKKRYAHTGHRHHAELKEYPGMKVEQHSTLAARDAYAARGGWLSERQAVAITYHDMHGEVARMTVVPGML